MEFRPLHRRPVHAFLCSDGFQPADHQGVCMGIIVVFHPSCHADCHSLFHGFQFFQRTARAFKPLADNGFLVIGQIQHLEGLARPQLPVFDLEYMAFHLHIVHAHLQILDPDFTGRFTLPAFFLRHRFPDRFRQVQDIGLHIRAGLRFELYTWFTGKATGRQGLDQGFPCVHHLCVLFFIARGKPDGIFREPGMHGLKRRQVPAGGARKCSCQGR